MPLTHAGYSGPVAIRYLFIDGACLRNLLKDISEIYFGGVTIDLDFIKFTGGFTKVFYYDALPAKKNGELEEEYQKKLREAEDFIEKLEMLDKFHVYLGKSEHRRKRTEQKQVDMLIAIHLLKHTFNRNMHQATLLTTDSDFVPLIDALVEAGMHISLWYSDTPNCRANKDLLLAADSRMRIGSKIIYQNTTENFSNNHPFPRGKSCQKEKYANLVAVKQDSENGSIELYKEGDDYIAVFPDKKNVPSGHYFHFEHSKLDILKAFLLEQFNIHVPTPVE